MNVEAKIFNKIYLKCLTDLQKKFWYLNALLFYDQFNSFEVA